MFFEAIQFDSLIFTLHFDIKYALVGKTLLVRKTKNSQAIFDFAAKSVSCRFQINLFLVGFKSCSKDGGKERRLPDKTE